MTVQAQKMQVNSMKSMKQTSPSLITKRCLMCIATLHVNCCNVIYAAWESKDDHDNCHDVLAETIVHAVELPISDARLAVIIVCI